MSANHTSNYNLCQWEPEDKVLREDFNADNAKLEAALTDINQRLTQTQEKTDAIAGTSYTTSFQPVETGYYSGNGEYRQIIELGYRPRAVLVFPDDGKVCTSAANLNTMLRGGLATRSISSAGVSITSNGFCVIYSDSVQVNKKSQMYIYLAFR